MVIDSSAVIAIFFDEPEKMFLLQAIVQDRRRLICAATLLEIEVVLTRRQGQESIGILNDFLERLRIEIVPFDAAQSKFAIDGFRKFGKSQNRAGLNFGDCFSYGLAKQTDEPLLFKGNDFSQTDLRIA